MQFLFYANGLRYTEAAQFFIGFFLKESFIQKAPVFYNNLSSRKYKLPDFRFNSNAFWGINY